VKPALLSGATETGLAVPARIPFDKWEQIGTVLGQLHASVPWWVGDWWVAGEREFGERAFQAQLGLSPGTVANYANVSRAYPPEQRVPGVSHRAHRIAQHLPPKERGEWLNRAAREGWSSRDLAARLAAGAITPARDREEKPPRADVIDVLTQLKKDEVWGDAARDLLTVYEASPPARRCPCCGWRW
jgi:hypothetical protein